MALLSLVIVSTYYSSSIVETSGRSRGPGSNALHLKAPGSWIANPSR